VTTAEPFRERGYARAVIDSSVAFIGMWLWAPFAVIVRPPTEAAFYQKLGFKRSEARLSSREYAEQDRLTSSVVLTLTCQGDMTWPDEAIDLCGPPW
jgi:hypothetical protein